MNRDDIKAWTDTLRKDQKVAMDNGSYTRSYSVGTVERLTATQVIVRSAWGTEKRYRRDNGREVGGKSYRQGIEPLTPEICDALATAALKSWISGLNTHHRVNLSLRVMRAMKKAHDAETAAEAAGPKWPADKFDDAQRAWCEHYERETDFEPQMDDYIAGNVSFVDAASAAVTWFEQHSTDQFLRMTAHHIPGIYNEEESTA